MTELTIERQKASPLRRIVHSHYFSFFVTTTLFLILYLYGLFSYSGFAKPQVFYNFFIDYAAVIALTVGQTFVLITGERDLTGGAVVAFECMFIAKLLRDTNLHVSVVLALAMVIGVAFGVMIGFIVSRFKLQSFIVTLAAQYVARGATAMLSVDTINIDNPFYVKLASARIPLFNGFISVGAVLALLMVAIGTVVLKYTRFGRNLYAVGGNRASAELMGLRTSRTVISSYAVSGFCNAFGGILYSLIMLSGYTLHAIGMEMEALSSSVIGGTLLSGGVAFMPGTLVGVLIQGVIQTIITFQGTLSAWWTKIVIAALLLLSIVMQALISKNREKWLNGK